MKTNVEQQYKKCLDEGYAMGAFNFVNLDMLKAILKGAENQNSPLILQTSTSAINFFGEDYLRAILPKVRQIAKVPVIFHLDHGKTFEDCVRCIDMGYDSVMIDASALDYEDNVALTKKVCDYAHEHGVWVEAELGKLQGVEDEVSSDVSVYTDPDQALDFVQRTGCNSLAVAIGTSHGAYKFAGEPKLRFDILSEIEKKLPNTPLVLHGASSICENIVEKINNFGGKIKGAKGIPENLLKVACTKHNITKVNMDSDLRLAYTAEVRKCLVQSPENFDLRKFIKPAMDEITCLVENKITDVLNSQNKA